MIPAIMGILGLVSGATELFGAGKRVYEEVTGAPSTAAKPADLEAELAGLAPEQQAAWAARMETEIARYRAETERLEIEQGEVSADMLRALGPKAAADLARLRMTTRPLIVRRMAHVLLIPAYVIALDGATILANNVLAAFGSTVEFRLLALALFASGSVYKELLTWAMPSAVAIVTAYMGLRSREKVKGAATGAAGGPGLGGAVGQAIEAAGGVLDRVKGLLRR